MAVGAKVKIEDIGPLATVIQISGSQIELELEGETFWMPAGLVSITGEEA